VPAAIVVAVWGKETGFGAAALPKLAVRALATEAFMGRRRDFFLGEFIDVLKIVEHHDIAPNALRSSVAGALGQPQFMPSVFLGHAQDFDGDGRRDIWTSVPDTLASIAAFLADQGWNRRRGWGLEVRVPSGVSCTLEGPDQGQPMAAWGRLGVTRADGTPLPRDDGGPVFLLMPGGRAGPAFIVTENFYVLKQYNYSDLYALYIGHAADRMTRADRPFAAAWGAVGGFRRGDVKAMQDALVRQGYDVGNADGLVGYKTRIATGLWQQKRGEPATCFPDARMVKTLR
jgi:lytic murein transglycosylase